jgi:hypothetical protein
LTFVLTAVSHEKNIAQNKNMNTPCNSPYKVLSNSMPAKVFSGNIGTAKTFSTGGVDCGLGDATPSVGLATNNGNGQYFQNMMPVASWCRSNENGEVTCRRR